MRVGEKAATAIGSVTGAAASAALAWGGTHLSNLSADIAYIVVVFSALLGATLGGVIGDWTYQSDWGGAGGPSDPVSMAQTTPKPSASLTRQTRTEQGIPRGPE
jgi:hypothetical protein